MGRRTKGRPLHGWLVIDKPEGPTSNDVLGRLRRALGARKAGHAGTLDPIATGVLAIAFGEATKTVPFVQEGAKAYRFTVRWGQETATDDREGAVTATSALRPDEAAIEAALPAFRGTIRQVPPQFSAVKVEGERAYDLARAGEELDLAARPLEVTRLELTGRPDADHAVFEMECGKGGYVRSIARDLGRALGCLGHVTALRRLRAGPFSVEDAVTVEAAESGAVPLLPVEAGLRGLPGLRCTAEGAARLRNGHPGAVVPVGVRYGDPAWAHWEGRPLAVGVFRAGELHPTRVFVFDDAAAPP